MKAQIGERERRNIDAPESLWRRMESVHDCTSNHRRMGNCEHCACIVLFSHPGLGFVAIAFVSTLKYPANPPSMGNPETIGMHTAAYFLLIAFSVAAMALSIQVERRLERSYGVWNAVLVAAGLFLVIASVISHFSLTINEIPILGVLFGWFTERDKSFVALRYAGK